MNGVVKKMTDKSRLRGNTGSLTFRRYNMFKKIKNAISDFCDRYKIFILVNILVALVLSIGVVIGWIIKPDNNMKENTVTTYNDESTFIKVDEVSGEAGKFDIYYDRETKVMYVMKFHGGVTVMVNPDGTPRLYEEE